mmetsp:Transcript_10291/g.22725  ORF Transcript_10291/g.22725 Transcript_10291/m.22725 type:complete len:179 (+) Transcript_10291:105-641(+)
MGTAVAATTTAHDKLLAHLSKGSSGNPVCWSGHQQLVQANSQTAESVRTVFLETLGLSPNRVIFGPIIQVQNGPVFAQLRHRSNTWIMFHGCKTADNEKSITVQGFQVSYAKSGVPGTWFSGTSNYSHQSFAFNDANAWRHLFVCLVTDADMKQDSGSVRVVGQSCAYPAWIVHYRCS